MANRKRRQRERSLSSAVGLGIAVFVGVAVLIFLVLVNTRGSAVNVYYHLAANEVVQVSGSQVALGRDMLLNQSWQMAQLDSALLITPLSLLVCGLTLGRLAPGRAGRKRILLAALWTSLGVTLVSIIASFYQIYQDYQQLTGAGFHATLKASFLQNYSWQQLLVTLLWIAACVLGAYLGLLWREAADRRRGATEEPIASGRTSVAPR